MKICFPARKANGDNYPTVDDMMQPLCQEPHGSWLAGTNNMWHGGIHITSKSAPGSVLTYETADTAVPLQFMTGGEVVAWRINQDYLIEVLSTDSRMVDFLSNKAQVKSGRKYVYIHPESFIYSRSGDTFTRTRGQVKKDIHKIMPQEKCHPFKDSNGKRWFDIGDGAWLREADVDADICQYDLDKLGFNAFEEPSTSDMTKSLHEGWIKDGFTRMAEWVRPERGIREKQVSGYYKALLRKMDSDNSGDLSGEELRQAVNYAELDVRDIAARMVVRHDSEWFGGSGHHRWRTFLKQLDPLCISYVRKWFDDMEWMSKVDGFSSGEPVWHMHPIVFLNALHKSEGDRCKVLFSKVSGVILRHEGGYVNDPDDKGGETNMGITIDTWKAFAPGDLNIPATSKTLKEMTKEQAETIYYNHYWKPKGFCKLENTKISLMTYDWTITSGRAIKQIRKLLHGEYNVKLSINNHMDDDMINCVNDIDNQEQLLNRIADVRKNYYRSLTVTDGKPNAQVKFLKGWINRVDDCLKVSV